MKIALIWTNANIKYPPKGWGAIEKYIWEYKINFEKLGHHVFIRYSNSNDLKEFDIVQVHTWNQALNLNKRNISYIFSFDDPNVIYYGKDSDVFKNNLRAIKNSRLSIVHGHYIKDYFNEENIVYLRHGANPYIFRFLDKNHYEHKLLFVARTDQDDRKGLSLSINTAKKLNLPITIVGPNEHFFKENIFNYSKLDIMGNKTDNELVEIYNNHTIFLHPSKLETGHPNLTLIESLYCGIPVVGTCYIEISGLKKIKPYEKFLIEGIEDVIENYSNYQKETFILKKSGFYDWFNISKDLIGIYKKVKNN